MNIVYYMINVKYNVIFVSNNLKANINYVNNNNYKSKKSFFGFGNALDAEWRENQWGMEWITKNNNRN